MRYILLITIFCTNVITSLGQMQAGSSMMTMNKSSQVSKKYTFFVRTLFGDDKEVSGKILWNTLKIRILLR